MIQILLALIQGLIAKVMEGLKRWLFNQEWFRIKFIYPKLGITIDDSVMVTNERPILHSEIDGGKYIFPVFANQTRIDDLRTSRLRESDTFVATYPKSGTHLCAYIVKLLAEGRCKIAYDAMAVPFYELQSQAKLDSIPEDTVRIMKTHLPLELIPPPEDSSRPNKIIVCLRDPKDVCISYYKFTQSLEMLTGRVDLTFDEWVDVWLGGNVDYGEWCDWLKPYWANRHCAHYCFTTYEGILADPAGEIRKIGEFLGYTLEEAEVEDVREKIKFNNMKQALMKSNAKAAAPMMRNGVTGEGSKVFSERQHNLFNEIFREKMAGTGFDVYSY